MLELPELKLLPLGPWTLVLGLVAIPAVRERLVPVAGAVVRAGVVLVQDVVAMVSESREEAEDLVAETDDQLAPAEATTG